MRKASLCALAAAALVAAAWPAPALADKPPKEEKTVALEGFTVTTTDAQGNVVAVRESSRVADDAAGPQLEAAPAAVSSASGCNYVDAWRYQTSWPFGTLLWKWHQTKHWCWSYPRITSVSVGYYASDVSSTYTYNGLAGQETWFYGWAGSAVGGHYSMRQGSFSNCVFRYGCWTTVYPWVKIWVNGNGAWTYDTGS